MNRRTIGALAIALFVGACATGDRTRADETAAAPPEETEPVVGVISSVDSQRIMVDAADDPEGTAALYERTTRSVVIREGREIRWDELNEGDAVRVTWDRGIFGPDRVARVEVLEGAEANRVRDRMDRNAEPLEDPREPQDLRPDGPPQDRGLDGFGDPATTEPGNPE